MNMRWRYAILGLALLAVAAAPTYTSLFLSGSTSGTLQLKPAAISATSVLTFPAGTTNFSATGGANQVVKQSSSGAALTVAALGSGDVPCAAMPALTGGVTSSAGSCATTAASVPTSALTGTITSSKTITFDSTTAVTAQTISFPIEWTSYTITTVQTAVNGGGSFTANVKIGSTSATGCSAISVSGATNTNTTCTAANTGSANDIINVVLSSPSGTVNQAYIAVVFTHTVN